MFSVLMILPSFLPSVSPPRPTTAGDAIFLDAVQRQQSEALIAMQMSQYSEGRPPKDTGAVLFAFEPSREGEGEGEEARNHESH